MNESKVSKGRITLQEFADRNVAAQYQQTLKDAYEVCIANGWGDPDAPTCCGERVPTTSFLGTYHAECAKCGKWAHDLTGPSFTPGGNACSFLDPDKVDVETDKVWIVGKAA